MPKSKILFNFLSYICLSWRIEYFGEMFKNIGSHMQFDELYLTMEKTVKELYSNLNKQINNIHCKHKNLNVFVQICSSLLYFKIVIMIIRALLEPECRISLTYMTNYIYHCKRYFCSVSCWLEGHKTTKCGLFCCFRG